MNINWKVRVKNIYFWIGLVGVIFTAVGANPAMLTSWTILVE
uniref:Holin n=1 Tax=Myoviridae sp. ctjhW4 TaxID=2825162 RepID=A0A8S5PTS2_9CAUD|nr:MAG TPA: holin [Myoviridae sp. ctjhW4]